MARVLPRAVIVTSSQRPSTSKWAVDSRYGRLWTTTACLAAAVWIAVAVKQSPLGSLSLLVVSLSFYGGLLVTRPTQVNAVAKRHFASGMRGTAAAVLVTVGIAHHVVAGLATAASMAATSPALFRRNLRP